LVAELAIAQSRHGVIFIKPLDRLAGRFDVPGDQLFAERLGDLMREDRFARAGFPLYQQRPLERDRGVNGDLQVLCRDIGLGAFETLHEAAVRCRYWRSHSLRLLGTPAWRVCERAAYSGARSVSPEGSSADSSVSTR